MAPRMGQPRILGAHCCVGLQSSHCSVLLPGPYGEQLTRHMLAARCPQQGMWADMMAGNNSEHGVDLWLYQETLRSVLG